MAGHGSGWITSQVTSQRPASASTPLDSNFERQPTRKSGFKSLSISVGTMACNCIHLFAGGTVSVHHGGQAHVPDGSFCTLAWSDRAQVEVRLITSRHPQGRASKAVKKKLFVPSFRGRPKPADRRPEDRGVSVAKKQG